MKKKLHELTREEYETLYRSGMMGEFYPDASGCYEKDVVERKHKIDFVKKYKDYAIPGDFVKVPYANTPNGSLVYFELSRKEYEEIATELAEERMNVIGQNGNDGEHYRDWKEEYQESLSDDYMNVNNLDGFNLGTYQRAVKDNVIDIYDILELYKVYNPATAHAIKKLLMPGQRGNKGVIQDLEEAKQSITRAIELEKSYHEEV